MTRVIDLHAARLARGLDAPRPFAIGDRVAIPDMPLALTGVPLPGGGRDIRWHAQAGPIIAFVTPDADGTPRVRVMLGFGAVTRRVDQVRPADAGPPPPAVFARGLPVRVVGREAAGVGEVLAVERDGGRITHVFVQWPNSEVRVYSPWRLVPADAAARAGEGPGGTAA